LYYDTDLSASLHDDRDGNGRPDGWYNVDMSGNATNGAVTTVFGIPPGKLIVSGTIGEPFLSQPTDVFHVSYEKKSIDPVTFEYSTSEESRAHTLVQNETLSFVDTIDIGDRIDRVTISFGDVAACPFTIESFSAVPISGEAAAKTPPPMNTIVVEVSPNPSHGMANISFHLDARAHTKVSIYSADGRLVERLIDRELIGNVGLLWRSKAAATGVYFVKVTAGQRHATKKITLVK
jgi:hypothetical protein